MSLRATILTVAGLIGLALFLAIWLDLQQFGEGAGGRHSLEGESPTAPDEAVRRPTFLFGDGGPLRRGSARRVREYEMPASPTEKHGSTAAPAREEALAVARLREQYDRAADPFERVGLVAVFSEMRVADAGRQLLDLLGREEDADVRLALLRALGQWPGRGQLAGEMSVALRARFAAVEGDPTERVAVLETLGELPDASAAAFLRTIAFDPASDPAERAAAAGSLLRQHEAGWPGVAGLDAEALRAALALDAQAAADAPTRLQAVLALAVSPASHGHVFSGLLRTEPDEGLRRVLQHLAME